MWELAPQNGFCCAAVSFVLRTLSLCACAVTTLRCDNSACPRQRTATCSTVPNARESTPSLPQSLHTVSGAGGLLPRETAALVLCLTRYQSSVCHSDPVASDPRGACSSGMLGRCVAHAHRRHSGLSRYYNQQRLEDRVRKRTPSVGLSLSLCVLSLCSLCVSAKGFARRSGQGFRLRGVQPVSFTW